MYFYNYLWFILKYILMCKKIIKQNCNSILFMFIKLKFEIISNIISIIFKCMLWFEIYWNIYILLLNKYYVYKCTISFSYKSLLIWCLVKILLLFQEVSETKLYWVQLSPFFLIFFYKDSEMSFLIYDFHVVFYILFYS